VYIIEIEKINIIFGSEPEKALSLLKLGYDQAQIKEKSQQLLAVHAASLSIKKGEIFVLMGLSGSGKSTLLRSINGLLKPHEGELKITVQRGLDEAWTIFMSQAHEAELRLLRRRHISMVFQSFALMPWRTVRENVQLGLELSAMDKAAMKERVDVVLEKVGLLSWQNKLPEELSGGMQQRVGLARALAPDPDILLMDEPFSALDPVIRTELQDEMLRLQSELKKTIVFVSHDLNEAVRLGSRIAVMNQGRIEQCAEPNDLLAHPKNDFVRKFLSTESYGPRRIRIQP
jgi:glycine betaine/proline transport system ATP-binding protein